MDITINYTHKNADITLIVEDDIITTAKVYMDGELALADDTITNENGRELKFNAVNKDAVLNYCKVFIDAELEDDGREECTNMALVKR